MTLAKLAAKSPEQRPQAYTENTETPYRERNDIWSPVEAFCKSYILRVPDADWEATGQALSNSGMGAKRAISTFDDAMAMKVDVQLLALQHYLGNQQGLEATGAIMAHLNNDIMWSAVVDFNKVIARSTLMYHLRGKRTSEQDQIGAEFNQLRTEYFDKCVRRGVNIQVAARVSNRLQSKLAWGSRYIAFKLAEYFFERCNLPYNKELATKVALSRMTCYKDTLSTLSTKFRP